MTELVLPPPRADQSPQALMYNATLGWLLHQRSVHTRAAYQRGLMGIGTSGKPAEMKFPAWIPWLRTQGLDPARVTMTVVDLYGREMAAAGIADRSQAQRLAIVSSWYTWLLREGLVDRNPAAHATRPVIDPADSPTVTLTGEQVVDLVLAARDWSPLAYALVLVLYLGAFRIGAVIDCNIEDYRWDAGARALRMRVKGSKVRTVGLDGLAATAVDAYLAGRAGAGPGDPLFVNLKGGRIDNPWVWRLLQSLGGIGPHVLRHAHVDQALEHGVPIVDVSQTLGHADIKTTMAYQTAAAKRRDRSGITLARVLAGQL